MRRLSERQEARFWGRDGDRIVYASASDVAALTPDLIAGASTFDSSTSPTLDQVNAWLAEGQAWIDATLAQAGYSTSVASTAAAFPLLRSIEALFAAARAELAHLTSRFQATERTRAQVLEAMFRRELSRLMGMDLSAYGVGVSATGKLYTGGISVTDVDSVESDTDRVKPRFSRGMFRHPGVRLPSLISASEYADG